MENREPRPDQPASPQLEADPAPMPDDAAPQPDSAVDAPTAPKATDGTPSPSSTTFDFGEWANSARFMAVRLRGWFARNTYLPHWLPERARHPALVYIAAVAVEVLATALTSPIVMLFPNFGFKGMVPLLGVVFFALQFGAGPGLVATIVGTALLYVVILAPAIASILDQESDVVGILLYLIVNLAILTMASRTAHARRQAQEANEQMERFLGITSHELRTPLTGMKTSIQMAERLAGRMVGSPESNSAEAVGRIRGLLARADGQVGRLGRLVDDLLDVSRIRSGNLELHMARCDLVALVRDLTEEQRLAHPQRRIYLRLPKRDVLLVQGDSARIGQVLVNYLTNALKYSAEDQPVIVGLDVKGRMARVWVRDHGPGLPPEELERIWQPFHRAEKISVQSGPGVGLGLGLHISRTIVERHGGEVGVRSVPGRGSMFWFALPRHTRPLHA
jgi:signal transduction histidine kinase